MSKKVEISRDLDTFLVAEECHCFPAKPRGGMSRFLVFQLSLEVMEDSQEEISYGSRLPLSTQS